MKFVTENRSKIVAADARARKGRKSALDQGFARAQTRVVPSAPVELIVIGASTGGPQALIELLRQLKSRTAFPVPILIVQHMPALFTQIFARTLTERTGWVCKEAVHGEYLKAGEVRLAPGDFHMRVSRNGQIQLDQSPRENFCRPAVDPLFRSAAQAFGPGVLGIVLTGTGEDGMRGSAALVSTGARVMTQDKASSVTWGMPGSVEEAGLSSYSGTVSELVERLKVAVIASRTPGTYAHSQKTA